MPGETGVTVVTTLVYFVFYRTRGCGRIERPAFPAPSFQRELDQNANLARKTRGEIAKLYLAVIARSASDEAIHTCFAGAMDCFATLAMTLLGCLKFESGLGLRCDDAC